MHHLDPLSRDDFNRVEFESLSSDSYRHLKSRIYALIQILPANPTTEIDFEELDGVLKSGMNFASYLQQNLGVGSVPPSSMIGSAISMVYNKVVGGGQDDEWLNPHYEKARKMPDSAFLRKLAEGEWVSMTSILPSAVAELMRLATSNILEMLRTKSRDVARKISEQQTQAYINSKKLVVEASLASSLRNRLDLLIDLVNQAQGKSGEGSGGKRPYGCTYKVVASQSQCS